MAEPARCQDCQLEVWLPSLDVAFDEAKHCLSEHLQSRPGTWPDQLACKDRTIVRLRKQVDGAKKLLKWIDQSCVDGLAQIEAGEPLGIGAHDLAPMTRARIDSQDAKNGLLELRLAQVGEQVEPGSSVMLVVVNPSRCFGQATVGVSRLPLSAPLSRLRAGDPVSMLKRDWPSVPDESWVVLQAIAEELKPDEVEEADGG